MIAILNKPILVLKEKFAPQFKLALNKWQVLQLREQRMLGGLAALVLVATIYLIGSSLMDLQHDLDKSVANLNKFTLFSKQAANTYKQINKVAANSFNPVNLEQIKADVAQVLEVKNPDILIQDGQMTLNIPNAQFVQLMLLLDQLRRSYAIFPSQVTITRQSHAGFVSFNATFWVKQS